MDRSRWQGEIAYLDPSRGRTGREVFSVSVHGDGSQVLRAQCEMDEDALVRECVLALDAGGLPVEAFVRTVEGGLHSGSRHYCFADDPRPRFFGTHSLINDGWLARLREGRHALLACSLQANGGGVPGLFETEAVVTFVGEAELDVPAGTVACRHWRVGYGDYPPLDMWVTGPLDLLVLMTWGHLGGRYELQSLEQTK